MKKLTVSIVIIIFILTSFVTPLLAAGNVSVILSSSSGTVRNGDTITVTGKVSASLMLATFDLNVTFNPSQLQYISADRIAATVDSGEMDIGVADGSIQFLYLDGDGGGSGITAGNVFSVTFKVIDGNVGDTISVGCTIKTAGDSSASAMSASGTGINMQIVAPLSTNTNLSSLVVSDGKLSPAFSPATTTYSMSVPFSVTKINITAKSEDTSASISISNPDLKVSGKTTLTVTVTAPSGAKKIYTIKVSRAQDKTYKASNNANLKSLIPNQGILSPEFNPNVTNYVISLPNEITAFNASGEMEDAKAQGVSATEIQLEVGENNFKMICKAEDGTEKTYVVTVTRMPFLDSPSSAATTTATNSGFEITLSGILSDAKGDPLAGKTIELHSNPQITVTDENGYYQFEQVTEGAHTIFIKELDGSELAQLSIIIKRGEAAAIAGNEITALGNTTINLSLSENKLSIKNITDFKPVAESSGIPIYIVAILLVILIMGAASVYLIFGKGKQLFVRSKVS